jgi:hypothetical protein
MSPPHLFQLERCLAVLVRVWERKMKGNMKGMESRRHECGEALLAQIVTQSNNMMFRCTGGRTTARVDDLTIPLNSTQLPREPEKLLLFTMHFLNPHIHRYDWTLLIPCFIAGLLGGAVYVAGFSLISRNTREEHR